MCEFLKKYDEKGILDSVVDELHTLIDKNIETLSGGELQKLVIAVTSLKNAQVYLFDEPSSYLDIKQRLVVARFLRKLVGPDIYIIVVEHDLTVLDYLADFISAVYGQPGAYGIITKSFGVREGINIMLDGYIPTENVQFRDEPLQFKLSIEYEVIEKSDKMTYPSMIKILAHLI